MCTNTCTYIHVVHVCTCSPFQTVDTEQPQHNTYICIDCINRWRKIANHPKRCGGGDYKSQLQWSYFPLPLRPCWPNTKNDCGLCVHVPWIQGTAISICKPHTDIVAAAETGMALHTQYATAGDITAKVTIYILYLHTVWDVWDTSIRSPKHHHSKAWMNIWRFLSASCFVQHSCKGHFLSILTTSCCAAVPLKGCSTTTTERTTLISVLQRLWNIYK